MKKLIVLLFILGSFCSLEAAYVECSESESLGKGKIVVIQGWGTLVCPAADGMEWCCFDPC